MFLQVKSKSKKLLQWLAVHTQRSKWGRKENTQEIMKPWSHVGRVPPMPRTTRPLCARSLRWQHKDVLYRKQELHSLMNSSLALITGGVTKIRLVWALPASSKTLLHAFCLNLNLNQLNLSAQTITSFLAVRCDELAVKLWEAQLVSKRSDDDTPGCVRRSHHSCAGQQGTLSTSSWRTPPKPTILARQRRAQARQASGCSKGLHPTRVIPVNVKFPLTRVTVIKLK